MFTSIQSACVIGAQGIPTVVEVDVTPGLPSFDVVGRHSNSVRETRDRVRAAVLNSGLRWPNRRITVCVPSIGGGAIPASLDLAIAIGIMVSDGQVDADAADMSIIGELGLDGSVRPVPGIYPMSESLHRASEIVVPAVASAGEAAISARHVVRPVRGLAELALCLQGLAPWRESDTIATTTPRTPQRSRPAVVDFATLVAAAGGHHMLIMGGPSGAGDVYARQIADMLPPLDDKMSEAVTSIHSAAGELRPGTGLIRWAPFRAPKHSTSLVAFVGGSSSRLRPGEVSLAHGGVLFLDELSEFSAAALDTLRQPLEDGVVRLSRAHTTTTIPASFQLVAATGWCPCNETECRCTASAIARYNRRIPASLLDRFAIRVAADTATGVIGGTAVGAADGDVAEARRRAARRGARSNHYLTDDQVSAASRLTAAAEAHITEALAHGRLSQRGARIVRSVALTIDDLAVGNGEISGAVMAQALMLHSIPLPR
jgi:magnesium chelatase family protein